MSANLYHLLQECFPSDRSRPFLETEQGHLYSYGDLDQQTARYAALLTGFGLAPGDRVLAQADKTPQALFLCFACLRAGLVFLPLNPAYRKNEVEYIVSDAAPKAVVCQPRSLDAFVTLRRELGDQVDIASIETLNKHGEGSWVEKASDVPDGFTTPPCRNDDVAALLYTSGTTGHPKGAMLTHRNLASNALALHEVWRWRATDVLLHSLPIYHVHGLFIACLTAMLSGARILFLPRFVTPRVLRFLPQSTVFMGVPTYYTRLLAEPQFGREVCDTMRLFISGSAPLLEQTFLAFQERTGFAILERYGMTEAGVITSNPVDGPRTPGTVGAPLPGVAVRVADEAGKELPPGEVGEMQIKGENVFAGYWRKPEETAASFTADGYFRSGDLGRRGENGYFSIVGRAKDLVISGGLNVYPKEVEAALDQIEGVVESAVIGVPHPDFGEAVVALVVRDSRREDLPEAALLARLKKELANYKIPKRIFFVDELPRNAMGKIQKGLLRAEPRYSQAFAEARQP